MRVYYINQTNMADIDWNDTTRAIISIISRHPDEDLDINPDSLTGRITPGVPQNPMFSCTLFYSPVKRNLYRLLSSLLYKVFRFQLGVHALPHTQIRAAKGALTFVERVYKPHHDQQTACDENKVSTKGLRDAIKDISMCLFDDVLHIDVRRRPSK